MGEIMKQICKNCKCCLYEEKEDEQEFPYKTEQGCFEYDFWIVAAIDKEIRDLLHEDDLHFHMTNKNLQGKIQQDKGSIIQLGSCWPAGPCPGFELNNAFFMERSFYD